MPGIQGILLIPAIQWIQGIPVIPGIPSIQLSEKRNSNETNALRIVSMSNIPCDTLLGKKIVLDFLIIKDRRATLEELNDVG